MIINITTVDGQTISLSNELGDKTTGYVQRTDILEAFKECTFQSAQAVKSWMLRVRDARTPISRQNILRQMKSELQRT